MKENRHRNKVIVFLRLLGVSAYSIKMALREKDKRNIVRSFNNFKDKYSPEFYKKIKGISSTYSFKQLSNKPK